MGTNTRTPLSAVANTTGLTLALTSVAMTAADGIAVWVVNSGNESPTIADNAAGGSNVYTAVGTATYNASDDNTLSQYFCKNAKATETLTITATWGTTRVFRGLGITQCFGHDTAATPAGVITATQTAGAGTDAVTTGNITPAAAPGLFLGLTVNSFANVQAVTAGFTDLGSFTNWGSLLSQEPRVEKKTFAATTPTPMTWTNTAGTGRNQSAGMAIKDAAAGGQQVTLRSGIAWAAISAINGIAKASVTAVNGLLK